MKKRYIVLVALLAGAALAQTPVFDPPVAIQANGADINTGYGGNASPFIVDWDGDSLQDLLLGQFDGGRVRFYRNVGANYSPVFDAFAYLQADGVDISVSSG
jgi:hypothetical protein